MSKTLEEWIALYEKKTGEEFKHDERFAFFYLPDKGFCEIADFGGKMLFVGQTSGDGHFWRDFTEKLARKLNIKVCGTICIRKESRAYIRLFGYKIDKVDEENGLKRYYCTSKNGGWYIMTEFLCESGHKHCYVTWEVKDVEV